MKLKTRGRVRHNLEKRRRFQEDISPRPIIHPYSRCLITQYAHCVRPRALACLQCVDAQEDYVRRLENTLLPEAGGMQPLMLPTLCASGSGHLRLAISAHLLQLLLDAAAEDTGLALALAFFLESLVLSTRPLPGAAVVPAALCVATV